MADRLRILLVEDEALLALQLEMLIADLGHEPVGHAMGSRDAIELFRLTQPDVALVDIHLLDGPTGVDVARTMRNEADVLVMFITANAQRIPGDFAGATGAIEKPYTAHGFTAALRFIEQLVRGGPVANQPPGVTLAPDRA